MLGTCEQMGLFRDFLGDFFVAKLVNLNNLEFKSRINLGMAVL